VKVKVIVGNGQVFIVVAGKVAVEIISVMVGPGKRTGEIVNTGYVALVIKRTVQPV
jgi:hypothetical protein